MSDDDTDDLRPEYPVELIRSGVRGKYARRFRAGSNVVLIDPDLAGVFPNGTTSFGACVPDLPGCVAVAETRNEVLALIKEAITFHIEGLRNEGIEIPNAHVSSEFVDVQAA